MRQSIILVWIASALLVAAPATAAGDSWVCNQWNLTREVLVVYPAEPDVLPCSVYYTKPDENVLPRTLWKASHTEGYCQDKAAAFVRRLETLGWHCRHKEIAPAAGS